jgi:hypothetical protein
VSPRDWLGPIFVNDEWQGRVRLDDTCASACKLKLARRLGRTRQGLAVGLNDTARGGFPPDSCATAHNESPTSRTQF